MSEDQPAASDGNVHPNREANQRSNRSDRPNSTTCAVLTPTGYRCKECIRGQQKIFDTSQSIDFPVAFTVAAVLSLIGSLLAGFLLSSLGFLGLWGLALVPAVGMGISEVVRRAIRRHRSPALFLTAAGGAAAGALPVLLFALLSGSIWQLVIVGAYAVLVTSSVYFRLRGIQVR